MKVPPGFEFRLQFGSSHVVPDCGAPCYKLFFSSDDVMFVRKIVGLTSLVSTLTCLWALVTFAVYPSLN